MSCEKPDVLTRDVRRSRKKHRTWARTINVTRLSQAELEAGASEYPEDYSDIKPKTRGDCENNGIRPCPFVSCKYNLYLDVNPKNGSIKLNFPDLEPHEMPCNASCALDVAERDGQTLEEVGEYLNATRERIRQIEVKLRPWLESQLLDWLGFERAEPGWPHAERVAPDSPAPYAAVTATVLQPKLSRRR